MSIQKQFNEAKPAFPLGPTATTVTPNTDGRGYVATHYGMELGLTIRDYFAAAALQGILSSTQTGHLQIIAKDAYGMADAMIQAREVKP